MSRPVNMIWLQNLLRTTVFLWGTAAVLGAIPANLEASGAGAEAAPSGGNYLLETIAGGSLPATATPGILAAIGNPSAVAADSAGNVFFSSAALNAVFRLDPRGVLTRVAGTGVAGYSGDGGPAVSARLNNPVGLALDSAGDLFIADAYNHRIRKVDTGGAMSTFAGNGSPGFSGDHGPAVAASLDTPFGVAVDSSGNLYLADYFNSRIREVLLGGTIVTIAGNGNYGFSGDSGQATGAALSYPYGVAVDRSGNVYFADTLNYRIRVVSPAGIIGTAAGVGFYGGLGDGGPATAAELSQIYGIAIDSAGNLVLPDSNNHRIRVVDASGTIRTVVANGAAGFSGDGGAALDGQVYDPRGAAADPSGNLYIADFGNQRIRAVSRGILSTVAGGATGDAAAAPFAAFNSLGALLKGSGGDIFVADSGANRVRRISAGGVVSTVAGTGISGSAGDRGPATSAQLNQPAGLALDRSGNLYISDRENARVRMVSPDGSIATVAGTGVSAYSGDNLPASTAALSGPHGIAVDGAGNLYIADTYNHRIRMVSTAGVISTVAGTGTAGYSGDGGPATSAELNYPWDLAVDLAGNLYIADYYNQRIRQVSPAGTITTVAGTGTAGYSGDGSLAASAELNYPQGVAVDGSGNLYIADTNNGRIRAVAPDGTISTVAGNGNYSNGGDGGPASGASFREPAGVAVGTGGVLYVADTGNNAIRLLVPGGGAPVLTVAATHSGSFAPGSGGQFSLTVTNAATAGASSGTVTVTEFPHPAAPVTLMKGDGWTCGSNTCSRADGLAAGASYPPIAVSVAVTAPAPLQASNGATVSGDGAASTGVEDLAPIGGTVPGAPVPVSPSSGAAGVPLSVSLSWNGVPGAASYNVYFGTTTPPPYLATTAATAYSVSNLAPATTYYWQVEAGNGAHTAASTISFFLTAAQTVSACDVDQDSQVTVADLQRLINEVLGSAAPVNDLDGDGLIGVADVQIVLNAGLNLGCSAR